MNFLDITLLKRYSDRKSDEYYLARNLSLILIFSWILTGFLSVLTIVKPNITPGIVYIFIIVNIALILVRIKKIIIATPLLLLSISIIATFLVFNPNALFGVYEVYKLAFYQLILIIMTSLITYSQIYAYLLTAYSSFLIILHFFLRGIKINKMLIFDNYEDYIIAFFLLILYGFILGKVINLKRKTIENLRISEEKYSTVINNSTEGIVIHQEGEIKFANNAASIMAGTTPDMMVGKSITDFVESDQRNIVTERMNRRLGGEEISELFNVRIINENGLILEVESKRADIIFQGRKSVLLFLRDITERKKLQTAVIQSEKMLSLGGLAAGMAHEINNPLAGILQNAQVISNRLTKYSSGNKQLAEEIGLDFSALQIFLEDRKIISQLDRIREAGTRASEIVQNMLNFARTETSRSTNSMTELLDNTLEMAKSDYDLKKRYDFRSIKIIREYEENLPLVACDSGQIQQVFFNILKNDAEAMYEKVDSFSSKEEYPRLILRAAKHESMVRIEIENNISGIPEDRINRIFDPFYTTKSEGEGTGLGLSISYFIIHESHKGNLKVESDGKTWVKFIIELPHV